MTEAEFTPKSRNAKMVAPMRRVIHVGLGGGIAAAALFAPIPWVRAVVVVLALGFVSLDVARLISPQINRHVLRWFQPLMKASEKSKRVTGASYMLLAVALCLLVFERDVAAAAILFLTVGDPAASLVGQRYGRRRIGQKSIEGTLAFFGIALAVGLALFWAGKLDSPWMAAAGSGSAALAELAPLPIDDNIWIPLAGALAIVLTGSLIQ
ncbi:MAG: glycerol-3-phosphate acyltransferase PlsY [Chloroflexi bacterium]|jgi:dolichol kinase|nr:MAG: glycerol-3-phosphate acyltransferase PlsY [Chloroflexota bacterium]